MKNLKNIFYHPLPFFKPLPSTQSPDTQLFNNPTLSLNHWANPLKFRKSRFNQQKISIQKFQKVTNKLGFEGGVSFSPDGNYIAFYAWRPGNDVDEDRYRALRTYHVTDTKFVEIYLIDMKNNGYKEEKLTDLKIEGIGRPTFSSDSKTIYFTQFSGYITTRLYSISLDKKVLKEVRTSFERKC